MSTQFTNRQWRLPNNENKDKQSNYSMNFDGSGYINAGRILSAENTSTLSVSFWLKIPSTGAKSYLGYYNSSKGWLLEANATDLYFAIGNGSYKAMKLSYSGNISINTWYHITMVFDGGQTSDADRLKVYVDGSPKILTPHSTPIPSLIPSNPNAVLVIGGIMPANINGAKSIDAVSIFNYALSASQVTTLYGSSSTGIGNPMSLSPKPVAYYPLGDQDAFNGADYLTPNASLKDFVFNFYSPNIIDTGTSLTITRDLTLSGWVKFTSTSSGGSTVISKHITANGQPYYTYRLYIESNKAKFRIGISTATFITGTTDINDGNWHHILGTYDGSNINLYVDGVSDATAVSVSGDLNTNVRKTTIGGVINGDTNTLISNTVFNGELSNAQVFNSALPATGSNSIETLYNNGSPLTSMTGFTSLQGWWKLDASATYDGTNWTIPDDSTNSNTGTSSGMTQANLVQSDLSFTSGYSPYALDFDGTNDYISIPNSTDFDLGSSFTISGWFNVTSYVSNMGYISFDSSTRGWFLFHQGTNLALYDGTAVRTLSSNLQPTNEWNSYIITHDGTDLIFYLNGQQNSTQAVSINLQTNGNDGQIGNQQFATGRFYNGSISNISIWNAALTSSQVTEIYSEGIPQNLNNHSAYSNLVSWWQLGSNSSFNTNWTVLDEKGSNNGTSLNMTESDIVDGVGSYANGLSSGMGGDEVIGDAPYSTSNSLSVNMDVEDRTTDTPS